MTDLDLPWPVPNALAPPGWGRRPGPARARAGHGLVGRPVPSQQASRRERPSTTIVSHPDPLPPCRHDLGLLHVGRDLLLKQIFQTQCPNTFTIHKSIHGVLLRICTFSA